MIDLNLKIPPSFLLEEERCDYVISSQMKEAWAVMLDLLHEFERVCDKYHLRWFAVGGTLLGVMRHQGFIPWDDDIDLGMPREDYDKLCSIANQEFKHPYFFQTPFTDYGIDPGMAKLRRSDTTCLFDRDKALDITYNQGIFIDIFPVDNIPDDETERHEHAEALRILGSKCRRSTMFYESKSRLKTQLKKLFFLLKRVCKAHWFEASISDYRDFEKIMTKYSNVDTKEVSTIHAGYVRNWIYPREVLYGTNLMKKYPFEFMEMPVPNDPEKFLTIQYGDWKKFVKGGSCHGGLFFDTDKPYTSYLKK